MARKDAKINALRRDLESMRVQLETKDKELRAVKTPADTAQTRQRTRRNSPFADRSLPNRQSPDIDQLRPQEHHFVKPAV